jgi:hypothetical protein
MKRTANVTSLILLLAALGCMADHEMPTGPEPAVAFNKGKGGKGGPGNATIPLKVAWSSSAELALRGDGALSEAYQDPPAGTSTYVHQDCGISAFDEFRECAGQPRRASRQSIRANAAGGSR